MSEHKFKAGDLVRLKGGGPVMTVDRYVQSYDPCGPGDDLVAHCVWFGPEPTGQSGIGSLIRVYMTLDVSDGALEEIESRTTAHTLEADCIAVLDALAKRPDEPWREVRVFVGIPASRAHTALTQLLDDGVIEEYTAYTTEGHKRRAYRKVQP